MTTAPSTSAKLESFWDYRELLKRQIRCQYQFEVDENVEAYQAATPATPLNERLIQLIWANQLFVGEGMRLADGRPVRVLDSGRWNGSAGPDFRAAQVMIGADTIRGDVEIHLESSLWATHGHQRDLDYNCVVLHVVFRNEDNGTTDVLHNGEEIPRLELEPYLFPDLETIRRSVTPDDFAYDRPTAVGRCFDLMTSMEPEMLVDFLDKAGHERLRTKVQRLEAQLAHADIDQVFYQALMSSMGSGPRKPLYYLLAKRAPAAELLREVEGETGADRRQGIESILFHVAGLMPDEERLADAPEESQVYARELQSLWKKYEPYWSDRPMQPTKKWFGAIRPVNFPTRRLGAIAGLLARSSSSGDSLLRGLAHRVRANATDLAKAKPARKVHPMVKELVACFLAENEDSFWATHYSFTSKPAARPMKLIGESTARSLVFNAVIPALALLGKIEEDEGLQRAALRLYEIFPPLQNNHITDFMVHRLFGEESDSKALLNTERRRQGLFQVFYACCSGEERHCEACYYLEGLGRKWD